MRLKLFWILLRHRNKAVRSEAFPVLFGKFKLTDWEKDILISQYKDEGKNAA
jgi:hypothetical protein